MISYWSTLTHFQFGTFQKKSNSKKKVTFLWLLFLLLREVKKECNKMNTVVKNSFGPAGQKLMNYFASLNITVTNIFHPAVFTCDEATLLVPKYEGGKCKNLFLKDKKSIKKIPTFLLSQILSFVFQKITFYWWLWMIQKLI